MRYLLKSAVIAGMILAASSPAAGAQSVQPVRVAPPAVIARLHVSEDVRDTWEKVVRCAGASRDTSKTLDQLVFMLREAGPRLRNGGISKGEYAPPDTIYITRGWEHSGWIVAHEMLHHALNTSRSNPHPFAEFNRCGLWDDPTSNAPDTEDTPPAELTGKYFAYPVLGYGVWIQGTLLAGHGWWKA